MVLDQIVAEKEMKLVGIADSNAEHLEDARKKYQPEVATGEFESLLDHPEIGLVFSFVSTDRNVEVCLESLGRGKPTLCVKPPALSVAEANQLAAAADDSGVFWASYETSHRLSERSRFLKKILRDGIIGAPISFYHVAHGGLPQPWQGQQGDSWWLDGSKVPGGAWIDHAIYAVDQIRWTLEKEVESVSATLGNRRHTELAVEDWGIAWMRLTNGFTAVMEDAWTADIGTRFDRWIGTEGGLVPESDAFVIHKRGQTERIAIPAETRSAMAQIAAAVRGEERLPMKTTCSVHNLAACLAVYDSFRTGRHVAPESSVEMARMLR